MRQTNVCTNRILPLATGMNEKCAIKIKKEDKYNESFTKVYLDRVKIQQNEENLLKTALILIQPRILQSLKVLSAKA